MPDRASDARTTKHLTERFRHVLRSPARHPRKVLLVFRDVLLVTIASFLSFSLIWDPLLADLMATVIPAALVADHFPTITPWDFLVYRANLAVVIGGLVGSARVGGYYWRWRRRRGTLSGQWEDPLWVVGFLVAGGVLFVTAIAGSYLFLVSPLAEFVATTTVVPLSADGTHPYVLAFLVLILCLSCGVASLLAYALVTLTVGGIASFETTAVTGAVALVAALVVGHAAWPLGLSSTVAWAGPLVGGYGVGVVLSLFGARLVGSGNAAAVEQQDE